jgi:hypothetical protein
VPWTSERQAEYERTLAMLRRSAAHQASTATLASEALREALSALPLGVVDAASSGLVMRIPDDAVRCGDLIVRHADGSVSSLRLVGRRSRDGHSLQ